MKLILIIPCLMICIYGCRDDSEASRFSEVLGKPPYASITDSIRREPLRDDLYFNRAVLLNQNNLQEPALEDFRKAWTLKKQERYALGAGTLLLDKNPDSAIAFLQDAIRQLPAAPLLHLTLARAYDARNRTDEALAVVNAVLKNYPDLVDFLKFKAALLDKKGLIHESVSALETAYFLAPYDLELNYELGFKYAETKNQKVIALMDSLGRSDSLAQRAEPLYYKGIYYSNINEKGKALELFTGAIARNYYFLNAYIEKGRVYFDQGKFNDAYRTFNLAMTVSPKFPDAYYWMGRCQEALGKKAEALQNYLRAYGLDKSFTEAKEAADKLAN
jgi:tetratricopeptide (TPR) repeat protein